MSDCRLFYILDRENRRYIRYSFHGGIEMNNKFSVGISINILVNSVFGDNETSEIEIRSDYVYFKDELKPKYILKARKQVQKRYENWLKKGKNMSKVITNSEIVGAVKGVEKDIGDFNPEDIVDGIDFHREWKKIKEAERKK